MLSSPQAIKFIKQFGGVQNLCALGAPKDLQAARMRPSQARYAAMAIERERLHLQRQARLARLKERSIAS